jgi:DNA-damage-inducible protein D
LRAAYKAKGYDDAWIEERIKNDLIRNELTDEWKERGAQEGVEFAILTTELHKGTFSLTVQAHKQYKLLPVKANLRDHMTPLELALTSLSEATAITLHQNRDSQGFPELKRDATDAGQVGKVAREAAEKAIGEPAISQKNYLDLKRKIKRKQGTTKTQLMNETIPTLFDKADQEDSQ